MNKLFLSLLIFSSFSMHAMSTDGSSSDTSVELGIDSENNGLLDTKKSTAQEWSRTKKAAGIFARVAIPASLIAICLYPAFSQYEPNIPIDNRTDFWVNTSCNNNQEFAIDGFCYCEQDRCFCEISGCQSHTSEAISYGITTLSPLVAGMLGMIVNRLLPKRS